MQCVVPNSGQLVLTTDSPDQCQGYLLLTPTEVQQLQPTFPPLSITDGAAISVAIMGCWAIAYSFRSIRGAFSSINGDSDA